MIHSTRKSRMFSKMILKDNYRLLRVIVNLRKHSRIIIKFLNTKSARKKRQIFVIFLKKMQRIHSHGMNARIFNHKLLKIGCCSEKITIFSTLNTKLALVVDHQDLLIYQL